MGVFLHSGLREFDMSACVAAVGLSWVRVSYQRCLPPLADEGLAGFLYLCPILVFWRIVIKYWGHISDVVCVLCISSQ